jgi:GT2 family glycosyltransferase
MLNWLHRLNRRRLQRRRARQAQAAWKAWLRQDDPTAPDVAAALQARLQGLAKQPLFSVIRDTDADHPSDAAALQSVQQQVYPNWELLVAAESASGGNDPRRRVIAGADGQSRQFDALARHARGEWLVPLRRHERLAPHALLLLAEAAARFDQARLIYADSDHVTAGGRRHSPWLLCDANLELLRSCNYLTGLNAVRARDWVEAGSGVAEYGDAACHALWLRLFERDAQRAVVHVPHVLLHRTAELPRAPVVPPPASEPQLRALDAHLLRMNVPANTTAAPEGGAWVRYAVSDPAPLVSIIIPTRNGLHLLHRCVETLLTRTVYRPFELLIVDNGSDDPATLQYLRDIAADAHVRVHRDDRPFNFAALNNAALAHCRGDVLALVNNDIEITHGQWLGEMVGYVCRPDVGAVGARLWYGGGGLQHGGVLLGLGGGAGHVHAHLRPEQPGYAGRARLAQEFSAVTAACLVVRRAVYEQVGGMDEQNLVIDFNDIDFCLKLRAAGYRVIWTPHAQLVHHESASRGANRSADQLARYAREMACLRARWSRWLDNDPAYNPNASLKNRDFEFTVAAQPRVNLLRPWFEPIA